MMLATPSLWSLVGTWVVAQGTGGPDALRALAAQPTAPALVAEVRARPGDAREALSQLLSLTVAADSETSRAAHLAAAERLARAFADAWQDSFYVRQVALFARWPPDHRAAKVAADSLRRVGNAAVGRDGVYAAMRPWRESLRRATVIGDSAGMAATLGNIGAGFYIEASLDSATAYLERSREVAEAVGDRRVALNATGTLASVSKDRGDLRRASELYRRTLEARRRIGDTRGAAADENNLGLIAQTLGDLEGARRHFESALALSRDNGHAAAAATNLTNLAGLASLEGDFARAQAQYRDAIAIYRELDAAADAAFVLRSLGLLAMRRGDYRSGRRALEQALAVYDRTGPAHEAVAVRRDLAMAFASMGELQAALEALRRAEQQADSARAPPALRAALVLTRADISVELNTLTEAERQYTRAEVLYRQAGDRAGEAEAQQGRGFLLLLREDPARAQVLLERALRTQEASGSARSAALTRLLVGESQRLRGDTAGARRSFVRAQEALRSLGDPVAEAAALGVLADLEAQAGLGLTAESLYQRGLGLVAERGASTVSWRLHAGLGLALRSRGALAEAARELRMAIADIERTSGRLRFPERRADYLADKWDVYAQLALTERARGRPGAAFEVSERLRGRQLLDLLARGRVEARAAPDSFFTSREQDLRRRITELTARLGAEAGDTAGARGPDLTAETAGAARQALARAQEAYAELLVEMREVSPEYAGLVAGEPVSWSDVAARLEPDEALLEYLLSDSGTIVLVVTRDTVAAVDLGVGRRDVARLIDFARAGLGRPEREPARTLWRGPLRQLYQQLLVPVEVAGLLQGTRRLLIAPHGELHYLPFAALLRGEPDQFLVERYDVTYVPSASVWLRLADRRRSEQPGDRVLLLAPRPDALPASRAEVEAIGRLYGTTARILVGPAASEAAFRGAAPTHGVVHLATYGVLNKHNPLFSFVELNAGGDADGRLEVHEVFGLDLNARLVVLSACQTALGSGALADVPAGDDWVGLVRAFLYAGAQRVLATLWPVEDRATAELMEDFYGQLSRGQTEVAALAAAQREALRAPATAHPFYWAGFVLVGAR